MEVRLVGFAFHGHFHCILGVVLQCPRIDYIAVVLEVKFGGFAPVTVLPDDMDSGIQHIGCFLIAVQWNGV